MSASSPEIRNVHTKILHALIAILAFVFIALIYGQFFTGISIRSKWIRNNDSNLAHNIGFAVSEFFTEYKRFPGAAAEPAADLDFETNEAFTTYLLGTPPALKENKNPRGIAFLTAGTGQFRSGIKLNPDGTGELHDNFGNYYRVRVDGNLDGSINSPIDNAPVIERVLVWSAGQDGRFDTWKDNIKTW